MDARHTISKHIDSIAIRIVITGNMESGGRTLAFRIEALLIFICFR